MWIFWLFAEYSLTKNKKVNFNREKVFEKPWNFAYIGFWVCWSQCLILELCDKYFLSYDGFLDSWEEGLDIGFQNMV